MWSTRWIVFALLTACGGAAPPPSKPALANRITDAPAPLAMIDFGDRRGAVPATARPRLDHLVRHLQQHPAVVIDVAGRQDDAEAVAAYLVAKGIPPHRMIVVTRASNVVEVFSRAR